MDREKAAAREQRRIAKAEAAARRRKRTGERPHSARPAPAKRPAPLRSATKPDGGARRTASTDVRRVVGAAGSLGVELAKLAREMLVIPLQLWLAAAEHVGSAVLSAWRRVVRPVLVWALRASAATLRFGERSLTPARAVAAVSVATIVALAASQWLDYRSISVGTDAYVGAVGVVAPAPEVESSVAGSAHSWVMIPLAVAAGVALVLALAGRRRMAALLIPIGIVVLAISLGVDAPKGLDEGDAAIAYQGAKASLLGGFWLQIVTAAVLIACGLMLPRYLRPAPAARAPAAGPSLFDRLSKVIRAGAAKGRERAHGLRLPKPSKPRQPGKRRVPRVGT